jgi:hypothetical protein
VKASAWEQKIEISGFAPGLPAVDSPPKISPDPKSWKCYACDMTENLWLNLSTGVIGCGRRQYDGSGGNSHAFDHFTETGETFPLCVKLGTITPEGGDVYSYHPSENDLVSPSSNLAARAVAPPRPLTACVRVWLCLVCLCRWKILCLGSTWPASAST